MTNITSATSIKEIQEYEIIGNAYHDMPLMQMINAFVIEAKNSMSDKIKALSKLENEVMGMSQKVTKRDVETYIEQTVNNWYPSVR